MNLTTKGLVLREVKTGEADRILLLLVPGVGIVSAAAKGSLRPKNKLFSACNLFTYSEFSLFEGRTMYKVDEATPLEVFFGLRQSVEGVAIASYLSEILRTLSPTGDEADRMLMLALHTLHQLSQPKADYRRIKAVAELRALSESGFMPDIELCDGCGAYKEKGLFLFDPQQGTLLCEDCVPQGTEPNLNAAALAAMRHIVMADFDKLYSFALGEKSTALLAEAVERFLLASFDYPPKSLVFLKSVL